MELARDLSAHSLFRRCLQCPNESPACPDCASNEVCSQLTRTCDTCASTQCVPISGSGMTNDGDNGGGNSGPNIGAIAGGVVGGVVFIVVASFLIWKFWFKGKRRAIEEDYDIGSEKMSTHDPNFGMHRSARASTHTVQSMASTVLTRASNIIQIAYIPGVTNRQTASPGALVPPVPPIPSALSGREYRDTASTEDQLFFTAGDIRDSTYSGMSAFTDANGRQSIAPSLARKSVASTIYRGEAQVSPLPAPTQTMVRGKAAVVNVNTGKLPSNASSPPETPPVPSIDFAKHNTQSSNGLKTVQVRMPTSTDALGGPSPGNSMKGAISAKPVALNIKKRPGYGRNTTSQDTIPTTQSIADAVSRAAGGTSSGTGLGLRATSVAGTVSSGTSHARAGQLDDTTEAEESSDDEVTTHARSRRSLLGGEGSPFSDDARVPSAELTPTLASVAYQAKKADTKEVKREQSPFEDTNTVRPRYSGGSWQS